MGYELKRVPLDFNWPLDKVWDGYVNPHGRECSVCGGSGVTLAFQRLTELVSLILLSGSDAARGKCHPYLRAEGLHHTSGKVCGPEMVELSTALAGRGPDFLGMHGACDGWAATRVIVKAAGLRDDWGACPACDGHGIDPEALGDYEAWEPSEPPIGEGYQMWETVTEGSPISPVFETPEGLARFLSEWYKDRGNYRQWLLMLSGPGSVPTLVMEGGRVMSGVQGLDEMMGGSDGDA